MYVGRVQGVKKEVTRAEALINEGSVRHVHVVILHVHVHVVLH